MYFWDTETIGLTINVVDYLKKEIKEFDNIHINVIDAAFLKANAQTSNFVCLRILFLLN